MKEKFAKELQSKNTFTNSEFYFNDLIKRLNENLLIYNDHHNYDFCDLIDTGQALKREIKKLPNNRIIYVGNVAPLNVREKDLDKYYPRCINTSLLRKKIKNKELFLKKMFQLQDMEKEKQGKKKELELVRELLEKGEKRYYEKIELESINN